MNYMFRFSLILEFLFHIKGEFSLQVRFISMAEFEFEFEFAEVTEFPLCKR